MGRREEQIRDLLAAQGLPAGQDAVDAVLGDIVIAEEIYPGPPPKPLKGRVRFANTLRNAVVHAQELCERLELGDEKERRALRRLQLRAELVQDEERSSGEKIEIWIAPACFCFLDTYRSLAGDPGALSAWREESKPVLYLTACCQLIDAEMTENRVLRAMQSAGQQHWLPSGEQEDARGRAYEAWADSAQGQKWRELQLPF